MAAGDRPEGDGADTAAPGDGDRRSPRPPAERPLAAPFDRYAREELPQAGAGTTGKAGVFEARFRRQGEDTRLVRDHARVPFHSTGALEHDDAVATVFLQTPTGGLAQGDRHHVAVEVDPDARAYVTGQAATKVLGMERNYGRVDVSLSVAEGGYLEYVPDPTILQAGARCLVRTEAALAADATLVVGDVVVPGRLARGEAFDFDRYRARTVARSPAEPGAGRLFEDAVDLGGEDPRRPGLFGENTVVGSLYAVTPGADGRELADAVHERVADGETRAGASTLPGDAGVFLRVLGDRSRPVEATLRSARDEIRRTTIGAGVGPRRKF
jgi:urease accessory protein